MEIVFFENKDNQSDVLEWIYECKKKHQQDYRKTVHPLKYLELNGDILLTGEINHKDIKVLKGTGGIWQIRINDNRLLYFYFDDHKIVFTNQFVKKQKETPINEIELAKKRRHDFLLSKKN